MEYDSTVNHDVCRDKEACTLRMPAGGRKRARPQRGGYVGAFHRLRGGSGTCFGRVTAIVNGASVCNGLRPWGEGGYGSGGLTVTSCAGGGYGHRARSVMVPYPTR